ncbi:MAG: thioredoxin [Oscillospiraceae bacterium]|nr:thioredoxin [Oscillospiraceae bacterium]
MSVQELTEENFDAAVNRPGANVVVDFYANWCAPCQMMSPVVEDLAQYLADRYRVCKVDIDASAALAGRYHVQSVPTTIIFQDGSEAARLVGLQNKDTILAQIV